MPRLFLESATCNHSTRLKLTERKQYKFLTSFLQVQKGYTNRSKQLPVEYFPSDMVCSIMCQILRGLEYLHTNWIIHRDMKPSNILVSGVDAPDPGMYTIRSRPCLEYAVL